MVNFETPNTLETFSLISDKPGLTFPITVVRTVPQHKLWCSAEGTPPINISLLRGPEVLAHGKWIAVANADKEGNYTCVATNKVGSDSKTIAVTLLQGMSLVDLISN